MGINLSDMIEACAFDEYDVDIATSGLCGTFALALKSVFPQVGLAVICDNDEQGKPDRASDGDLAWRHVVAVFEGELFDVEGMVQLEHLVDNYCWRNPHGTGGSLVLQSLAEIEELLQDGGKSYDAGRLEEWSATMKRAMAAIEQGCCARKVPSPGMT
jgi:hypothetical protein|nr:hypothetical protein [Neorhizobium tomejilense]